MSKPKTIYQPPPGQLPAWVKTEGDCMVWLGQQEGVEPGSRWTTEGSLPDGGRIWTRVDPEDAKTSEATGQAKGIV